MRIRYKELYKTYPRMSVYQLHRQLWKLFPENPQPRPFIYRFDELGDKMIVCLRTSRSDLLLESAHPHLLDVSTDITHGQHYGFRIRVVPEIRTENKVIQTPRGIDAEEWFAKKAQGHGFEVLDIRTCDSRGCVFYGKRGRKITLNDTTIEGELKVKEGNAFEAAMLNGIGRHKGFGYGLLQLKRNKN